MDFKIAEINERINNVRTLVMHNGDGSRYRQEMEEYLRNYNESWIAIGDTGDTIYLISCNINVLLSSIQNVTTSLDGILQIMMKRLNFWKRSQALSTARYSLDDIQNWFNSLAKLIRITLTLIETMRCTPLPNTMTNYFGDFDVVRDDTLRLLRTLIMQAFIVYEQPRRVIQKKMKCPVTVRLLLTDIPELNNSPVTASILSEAKARLFMETAAVEPSGELSEHSGLLELHEQRLACNLRNSKIELIRRSGNVRVTDEKFTLLFQSTIHIYGLDIDLWAMSLPMVVIVNVSQEPESWPTIAWDNANFKVDRIPFAVEQQVPWKRLASALNMIFFSQTGRGLTPENLDYLRWKAFRGSGDLDSEERPIEWSQIFSCPLPSGFTFWKWFYDAMKLTKHTSMKELWTKERIIGFIDNDRAEEMLRGYRGGTFLLRFSDSICGAISITGSTEENGGLSFSKLGLLKQEDLDKVPLANVIIDLETLHFLYPDTPKRVAFREYYEREPVVPNMFGYTPLEVKVTAPGDNETHTNNGPNLPQESLQASDTFNPAPSTSPEERIEIIAEWLQEQTPNIEMPMETDK